VAVNFEMSSDGLRWITTATYRLFPSTSINKSMSATSRSLSPDLPEMTRTNEDSSSTTEASAFSNSSSSLLLMLPVPNFSSSAPNDIDKGFLDIPTPVYSALEHAGIIGSSIIYTANSTVIISTLDNTNALPH